VIGHSVRGASHTQKGVGNQDYIRWKKDRGRVILALADGHGNAKSFRSATGSMFAVDVSIELASDLLRAAEAKDHRFLSLVKDQLETDIPRTIVHNWLQRVDDDLKRNPFTEQELAALTEQDKQRLTEHKGRLAYGSTLLTAIATESFVVFWQIGDGDVLTVSGTGKVSRPLPSDPRLIANETSSLCSSNAPQMFRGAVLGTPAPMIMLSTDGFANSFRDDEGFFKFGTDVSKIIVAEGLPAVDASLPDWLAEITERGSGDDVSLGIVCRPPELAQPDTKLPKEPKEPDEPKEPVPAKTVIDTPRTDTPRNRPEDLPKTLVYESAEEPLPAEGDASSTDSRSLIGRTIGLLRRRSRTNPPRDDENSAFQADDRADYPSQERRDQR
jgi:hypothetical protein